MLDVKRERSQLLKQTKLLAALAALRNTQHKEGGESVTKEINLNVEWILKLRLIKGTNVNPIWIVFGSKNALVTEF